MRWWKPLLLPLSYIGFQPSQISDRLFGLPSKFPGKSRARFNQNAPVKPSNIEQKPEI
jgi:hypothetical protein